MALNAIWRGKIDRLGGVVFTSIAWTSFSNSWSARPPAPLIAW
jgi:hypothetical protein